VHLEIRKKESQMNVEQLKVGMMDVFAYIVSCAETKEAMVIDPAGDEERIAAKIKEMALDLKYIVNTHGHADHTCGNAKMQSLTGALIVMHKLDDEVFNSPEGQVMARQWGFAPSPPADKTVEDGDKIAAGRVSLEVLHTPGHSPGGICLLGDGQVFTGDTMFVGAIGRTDLPGASMADFMKSIQERLLTLPGETVVWPGHDYGPRPSSTIEIEKQTNPWLR
jgi:glyoxylase-like metal-dependent hydrolase (beta-lactamase superfamily II)